MIWVALRLAGPEMLRPWRSPLLRWRMETFGITGPDGRLLHAEQISAPLFIRFFFQHHRALLRFLKWAATL
jgi:hypothetical protein